MQLPKEFEAYYQMLISPDKELFDLCMTILTGKYNLQQPVIKSNSMTGNWQISIKADLLNTRFWMDFSSLSEDRMRADREYIRTLLELIYNLNKHDNE